MADNEGRKPNYHIQVTGVQDGTAGVSNTSGVNIQTVKYLNVQSSAEKGQEDTERAKTKTEAKEPIYVCQKCEWRSGRFKCPGTRKPCKARLSKTQNYCTQCKEKIDKAWFNKDTATAITSLEDRPLTGYTCSGKDGTCNFISVCKLNKCPKCNSALEQSILCPRERKSCNNLISVEDDFCNKCRWTVKKEWFDTRCHEIIGNHPCLAVIKRGDKCCPKCGNDAPKGEVSPWDVRSVGIKCPGTRSPCRAKLSKNQSYCTQCKHKTSMTWFIGRETSVITEEEDQPLAGYTCTGKNGTCCFTSTTKFDTCPRCEGTLQECILCPHEREPCNNAVYPGDDYCTKCRWTVDYTLFSDHCDADIQNEDKCCPKCGDALPEGTHMCSIRQNPNPQPEVFNQIMSQWTASNLEGAPHLIPLILAHQQLIGSFSTLMTDIYKAQLHEITAGSLVFTFLHETIENAQHMVNDSSNVRKHIVAFLNELDSGVICENIHVDVVVKQDSEYNGDIKKGNLQHHAKDHECIPGMVRLPARSGMTKLHFPSGPNTDTLVPIDKSSSVDEIELKLSKYEISEMRKQIEELEKSQQVEQQKHEIEKKNLQDKIVRLELNEENLNRMLESISLGGQSVDSGVGSDSSTLASLRSKLTSLSTLSLDSQGATSGQAKSRGLLKNLVKKLSTSKAKFVAKEVQAICPAVYNTDMDARLYFTDQALTQPIQLLFAPPVYTKKGPVFCMMDLILGNLVQVQCTQHKMDTVRANTKHCHMTEDTQLMNGPPTNPGQQGSWGFKNYWGTCSTSSIHLPPSPSCLTPPAPQYWETETAVGVKKRLDWWWRRVLEIGVVDKDTLDSDLLLYDSPRSWCVKVGLCGTHKGICTQVWNHEKHVKCVTDTMSNTPGTSYTLRYGVVVDVVRGRVGFVDVDRGVILEKMDVEFTQTICPVFGVHPNPDYATVEMKLLSGSNIMMTENKQKLIYSCLT